MDSKADQRRLTVKALGSRGLPTLKLPNQRCQAQRFEIADFLFGRALRAVRRYTGMTGPRAAPASPPDPTLTRAGRDQFPAGDAAVCCAPSCKPQSRSTWTPSFRNVFWFKCLRWRTRLLASHRMVLGGARSGGGGVADVGRERNASRLEQWADDPGGGRAQGHRPPL